VCESLRACGPAKPIGYSERKRTDLWNTGCNVVFNRTNHLVYVRDGEDKYRQLIVEPSTEASFQGTKAFRFLRYNANTKKFLGWFYMFQNFTTNEVCWADWGSETPFDDKISLADPSSYVDIVIENDSDGLLGPSIRFTT
jgi:hypothetical protein